MDDLIPSEFVACKVRADRSGAESSPTKFARHLLSTYPRLQHLAESSITRYVRQALTTLPGESDLESTQYAAQQAREAERWKRAYLAQEADPLQQTCQALKEAMREALTARPTRPTPADAPFRPRCLVAVATDIHLGQPDIERTEREFRETTLTLIRRTRLLGGVDEVVFPIGSDFLHVDTDSNTTTKGTPQAVGDVEPAEVIRRGFRLIKWAIDEYRSAFGRVVLIGMHGNHDLLTGKAMLAALEIMYEEDPEVHVECTFEEHTYYQPRCGGHILGFHHGHGGKATDLPQRMATDRPAAWGECSFRSWYTGHLHHRVQYDDRGTFVHQCPALSRPGKWSKRHGYVGSRRGQVGFVLDPEDGLVAELCAYLPA